MSALPAFRPLPARPNLAAERKQAKTLLRRLRAGDLDALARARDRHPGFDASRPEAARLADAQLVVAREYGFASWPRLVHYFEGAERQQQRVRRSRAEFGRGVLDAHVRGLLARHRAGDATAGRVLAAYVPRCYGLDPDAALAAALTEDDARLAVARGAGFPSWDVALERADVQSRERHGQAWEGDSPHRRAAEAMTAADLAALEQVVAAHPALLHPSSEDVALGRTLIAAAIGHERRYGAAAMRPIMEWLAARGFDRQLELDIFLCGGRGHMTADEVRALLAQGADPNWVAPNGIPVLEHALLRYWDGEAVDVLAARAAPRRALWLAAGLGDVDGVRRCLDVRGRPTPAARRLRPDFDAAGKAGLPSLPDPDDEELLVEAFFVAVLNGRAAVLEYMVSRGTPVNSLVLGFPMVAIAAGNGLTAAVEALVRCGADLDLRGTQGISSAREMAAELFGQTPHDAVRRRIAELCGLDLDAVRAERDARPVPAPVRLPVFEEALTLAADDAARLEQPDVRPENLLVGVLRLGGAPLYSLVDEGRMDLLRFRQEMVDRMRAPGDRVGRPPLPMRPDAQAAVDAAVALATERRQDVVHGVHLLAALIQDERGPAPTLLTRYGVDVRAVAEALTRAC